MNTFVNDLKETNNYVLTENDGLAHKTTNNNVYDMFAVGGAYRKRSDEDCILLFKKAFEEDANLALKCLFYIRDCRGGQGERRFFRVVYKWLANNYPAVAAKNLPYLADFGRWDDLFILFNTPIEKNMLRFIKNQFVLDLGCKTPSLLGKWMPSENASSKVTVTNARKFIKFFGITSKEYRKNLVSLREKIKIVETLMSQNRWEEIEFDKIPSKAGLKYKNAFARRDIIAKKYEQFMKDENTKVNAGTLYPYEIVAKAAEGFSWSCFNGYTFNEKSVTDRTTLEKYWNNLPDYCAGKDNNIMCVVDTSGSMTGKAASAPINVAIALGMYCAERLKGDFNNKFISFSSIPTFIEIEGVDFVDKVQRIYQQNLCENTNLEATFNLLYNTAVKPTVNKEDVPDTIVVLSDMEIDYGTVRYENRGNIKTMMEYQREKWAAAGLKMPKLVYWTVESRGCNKFLDDGPGVTYVSGASPILFEQVLKGMTGYEVMLDKLMSDRYEVISA